MIAKLKWRQQNIEQLQNLTIGARINNNRITALQRTAAKATEVGGGGALMHFMVPNLHPRFSFC